MGQSTSKADILRCHADRWGNRGGSGSADSGADGPTHTVQAGENLFRIALRYGRRLNTLASANGITDPTRIYVGQVLVIPDSTAHRSRRSLRLWSILRPPRMSIRRIPGSMTWGLSRWLPLRWQWQRRRLPSTIRFSAAKRWRVSGRLWGQLGRYCGGERDRQCQQIYAGQQLIIPGASAPGTAAVAPPVAVASTESVARAGRERQDSKRTWSRRASTWPRLRARMG